jgi:hypothetical protein
MSAVESAGLALFGVMFALVAIGFALQHRLYSRLQSAHPEQYERLGSPTLFLNNSISNGLKTMRFLWSRRYRELGDPKLSRLCRIIIVINVIYFILFAGLSTAFILAATLGQSAA